MSMNINMKPDYSYLFSSMSKSGSSLGNLNFLSDYASIKNGSYGKLLKAYYSKEESNTSSSTTDTKDKLSTSLAADSAKILADIDKSADSLKESADSLINKGKDSLFKEKEVTIENEDGTTTTTKEYDMDAIYNAVSDFVKNYNSLLDDVSKSDSESVRKAAGNMKNITRLYSKTLEKAGISVGSDNKLSIDEDSFRSANMSTIKSIFNESPSFAYTISSQASFIDFAAGREAVKANTYNFKGSYTNNYSMGNIINNLF